MSLDGFLNCNKTTLARVFIKKVYTYKLEQKKILWRSYNLDLGMSEKYYAQICKLESIC